jgi:hypothetical protein
LGDFRLISDGRDTFAAFPTGYRPIILKQVGEDLEIPSVAQRREVEAWLAANPEPVMEPFQPPHRVELNNDQMGRLVQSLRRDGYGGFGYDHLPQYQAMYLEGETYALSFDRVFQWREDPESFYRDEFVYAGYERGEEVKRWFAEHPPAQQAQPERSDGADKHAEALKVLHEIVDPHVEHGGIQQGEAMKAAQEQDISGLRALRLLKDPAHFRFVPGKSRKEGNRIFPRAAVPEEPEDEGF